MSHFASCDGIEIIGSCTVSNNPLRSAGLGIAKPASWTASVSPDATASKSGGQGFGRGA